MADFLAHTDKIRREMLEELNLNSIDELFNQIAPSIRVEELSLPAGISEQEASKSLLKLAQKNKTALNSISFLGGGVYNRYIPACISAIIERSEFLTSYTPYQPEVSQGTLQAIFDYQTLICNLTGMDVSNASVYDGATACAEAVFMASRITRNSEILVSAGLNPEYRAVLETYCYGADIKIDTLELNNSQKDIDYDKYACVLVQNPNYFGEVQDIAEIEKIKTSKAKLIMCIDPISVAILKSPGNYGADIVVGDFQPLGIPMNFGGPHGGFIACKQEYLRQLPGRIVGLTRDKAGNEAFTLTLQTREQHIKRERATSNICTNNALMALAATVYLSVLGAQGVREVANISIQRAHYMAQKLAEIPGISLLSKHFLYEFVIKLESINSGDFIKKLAEKDFFIGINLAEKFPDMQNCLLITVTEMNSAEDIETALEEVKNCLRLSVY